MVTLFMKSMELEYKNLWMILINLVYYLYQSMDLLKLMIQYIKQQEVEY
jgi:hypothetical protein